MCAKFKCLPPIWTFFFIFLKNLGHGVMEGGAESIYHIHSICLSPCHPVIYVASGIYDLHREGGGAESLPCIHASMFACSERRADEPTSERGPGLGSCRGIVSCMRTVSCEGGGVDGHAECVQESARAGSGQNAMRQETRGK
jgi:hypothetical protein